MAKSFSVFWWVWGFVMDRREGLVHHFAPAYTSEHLFADRLHHCAAQDAPYHAEFHVVGRVVQHTEFRFVFACEQRVSGILAEIFGDDDRDRRLALANRLARRVQRGRLYIEVLIAAELGDQAPRDVALVLVNHQHRDFARLRLAALPAEQESKERGQYDGHQQTDDHRFAVAEKQFQIFSHQGQKWNHYESRRLLPVRVRKTVSRSGCSLETW